MNALGQIAGVFLLIMSGWVILSATWNFIEGVFTPPIGICPICLLNWFVSILASMNTIGLGLMLGLSVLGYTKTIERRWTDGSWTGGRIRSILAMICGLIMIGVAISVLSNMIQKPILPLEYLESIWIPNMVVGASSLVSGVLYWR